MGGFQAAEKQRADIANEQLKREVDQKRLQLQNRQLDQQGAQFKQEQEFKNKQLNLKVRKEIGSSMQGLSQQIATQVLPKVPNGQMPVAMLKEFTNAVNGQVQALIKTGVPASTANLIGQMTLQGKFHTEKTSVLSPGQSLVGQSSGRTIASVPKEKEPLKAQSSAGKVVADRIAFVAEFGKDSPQVKAFDEAAKSEGKTFKLTDVSSVRGQFLAQSKAFVTVRNAFSKIAIAGKDPSAAGDLALIFNFMKLLDPGSVVRESEFATAANAAGVPDRIKNTFNRVLSGERLAPEQRKDFLTQAERIFDSQIQSQTLLEKVFGDIAERAGMKKEDVAIDLLGEFRSQQGGGKGGGKTLKFDAQGNPI